MSGESRKRKQSGIPGREGERATRGKRFRNSKQDDDDDHRVLDRVTRQRGSIFRSSITVWGWIQRQPAALTVKRSTAATRVIETAVITGVEGYILTARRDKILSHSTEQRTMNRQIHGWDAQFKGGVAVARQRPIESEGGDEAGESVECGRERGRRPVSDRGHGESQRDGEATVGDDSR